MIEIWWSPQTTNILTHHRIITSSGWYKNCNFELFSHFRGTKCRVEANNTPEAVVACSRHVMKQRASE